MVGNPRAAERHCNDDDDDDYDVSCVILISTFLAIFYTDINYS